MTGLHALLIATPQTTHQDAINSLQTGVQQAREAQEAVQQQLADREATIKLHLEQLAAVQATVTELTAQLSK